MRKITTLLLLIMTIALSGCVNSSPEPIDQPDEPTAYEVIQDAIDNTTVSDTIGGVLLPANYGNVTISWSSNIAGTITTNGLLIQGNQNQLVSLTAIFTYQDKLLTKLYTTTVLKDDSINQDLIDVTRVLNQFSFDDLTVTQNIEFYSTLDTVSVSWDSDNTECVSNTGVVTRPSEEDGDCTATVLITFSKGTESESTSFTFTVLSLATTVNYTGYYAGIDGLDGAALSSALHNIINNGFSGVTYGEARYILDETDEDPDNPGNLILVYLQLSRSGVWSSGAIGTWNREHVWPQSLLGVSSNNSEVNIASDLHNLKPSDPQENSSRSNDYFAEDSDGLSGTYEPPSAVKGDIARILFYMSVMYDSLDLVDNVPSTYEMALLATLLEWNLEDPVDAFEMNRNEIIYSYQGNRNPFIDHPELADLIWNN